MRRVYRIIIILALVFILTGCTNEDASNLVTTKSTTTQKQENKTSSNNTVNENPMDNINYEEAAKKQMELPTEGETVATIKVKDYGDIKVKFFNDVAPKAVENFTTLAKQGYYNGVIFHRVIDEFMIQGGDPTGTGTGGESIWGKGFGEEIDFGLVPYRGSLCMASTGYGRNGIGSQFFITQANYSEQTEMLMKQGGYPEGLIKEYKTYGGYPSLYLQYTVFGQVFEGMDIVDKIAKVQTHTTANGQADKPVKDVIIEKVEVTTY